MATTLRSSIEATKRVFKDRLSTDQQPLDNPNNIDGGPGDPYVYANVGDSNNLGIGFDCSGLCSVVLPIALRGLSVWAGIGYQRQFSTDTFASWAAGPGGGAWKQTTEADLQSGSYPLKVMIHTGSGPDGHMACIVDGVWMESNGTYGLCTAPDEITSMSYWDQFWVWTGTITEDTPYRETLSYPRGLDYAGGYISGADLAAAGITFVCRYVASGGQQLPDKILSPNEFLDLVTNGIAVVFNWESTADAMLGGQAQGAADAQTALAYIQSLLAAAQRVGVSVPPGYQPVVYFSCDFDEAPDQDVPVEAYLQGAASVLGGMGNVGIYGAYWICTRAQAAVGVAYIWQTEAWSGNNVTSAANIVQRNGLGYQTEDGVQCDIDEAHSTNYGQFSPIVLPVNNNGGGNVQPSGPTTLDSIMPSGSRYATPGAAYTVAQYISFIDARTHEAEVERYAALGDPGNLALVQAAAAAGDVIAQRILADIKPSVTTPTTQGANTNAS